MTRGSTLARNALLISVAKLFVQGASFLLLPVFTTHMAPAQYGLLELVLAYCALVGPAALLQLDAALFRELIDKRSSGSNAQEVISTVWCFGLLLSVIAGGTVYAVGVLVDLRSVALAGVLLFGFMIVSLSHQTLRGLGRTGLYALSSIVSGVLVIAGNLISLLILKAGAPGVIASTACGYFLGTIVSIIFGRLWRYMRIGSVDLKILMRCLRYAGPLIPNGVSWWLIDAGGRAVLALLHGLGPVGLLGVANRFAQIFNQLFGYFNMAWIETASVAINDPDRGEFFSRVFNRSLQTGAAVVVILISTIPLYFPLLVGPRFLEAAPLIPLLLSAGLLNSWVSLYSSLYIALRDTRAVLMTTAIAAVVALTLSFFLARPFGAYGIASSAIAAWSTVLILRHRSISHQLAIIYSSVTRICITVALLSGPTGSLLLVLGHTWSPWIGLAIGLGYTLVVSYYILTHRGRRIDATSQGLLRTACSQLLLRLKNLGR